jgi:hypothetical protein
MLPFLLFVCDFFLLLWFHFSLNAIVFTFQLTLIFTKEPYDDFQCLCQVCLSKEAICSKLRCFGPNFGMFSADIHGIFIGMLHVFAGDRRKTSLSFWIFDVLLL